MTLQKYGEIMLVGMAEAVKENPDLFLKDLNPQDVYIAGAATAMLLLLETILEH